MAAWRSISVGRCLVLAVGALALAQLVPVERTNPPVVSSVQAPAAVKKILEGACFDCHSHETRWPWYSQVAPLSWGIARHVRDGRKDLNFSVWPVLDFERQDLIFHAMDKQLRQGAMPPRSYALVHAGARLSAADRAALLAWVESGLNSGGRW